MRVKLERHKKKIKKHEINKIVIINSFGPFPYSPKGLMTKQFEYFGQKQK